MKANVIANMTGGQSLHQNESSKRSILAPSSQKKNISSTGNEPMFPSLHPFTASIAGGKRGSNSLMAANDKDAARGSVSLSRRDMSVLGEGSTRSPLKSLDPIKSTHSENSQRSKNSGGAPALKSSKLATKGYSQTLFISQLVNRDNIVMLNKLYPSQQKYALLYDIDTRIQKMVFPRDFLANERQNLSICEYILEILKSIQQCESNLLSKLNIVKKSFSCSSLIGCLFERNDFKMFEMIVKYFFLKFPLVKVSNYNSAMLCGEIISLVLKESENVKSFFSQYKRKFYMLIGDHILYLMKLIITSYTNINEVTVTSSHMKLNKVIGRHNIILIQLLHYVVKYERIFQKDYLKLVSEYAWEITLDWFFTYGYELLNNL